VRGLFVTGTDTGVGKTFVSLALIHAWRAMGLRVGVMKPCETGCEERDGELIPEDATALLAAAGSGQSLDEVCPVRFRLPMAPAEAAALEGGGFSMADAARRCREIGDRHDVTLVEGAGGLLVPFEEQRTTVDLIAALDLPVLIVARAGLGTINHTWLTVERARSAGLEVLGVVFTRALDPTTHPPGPDEEHNPAAVERLCRVEVLGRVPYLAGGDPRQAIPALDMARLNRLAGVER